MTTTTAHPGSARSSRAGFGGSPKQSSAADQIFSVIKRHRGFENAIDAIDICDELGWSSGAARNVRRIISDKCTTWPEIVCARPGDPSGGGGYYIAETYEEIERYWSHLDNLFVEAGSKLDKFEKFVRNKGVNLKFARNNS